MERTYFFFIHAHQPVAHIVHEINSRYLVLSLMWLVSKVYTRDSLVPPPLTEGVLIVEKAEFLNNIVHN